MPNTELVPAIGYIRVSTWFEEKISDELQKASIQEAAKRKGRIIVRWVPDLDVTGRNFKRRIMEAISAIETGEADGAREIWVWKYSRFGRTRHGVAVNLARVEKVGGALISATEEVDATTATGRFTRGMLFELAAFESDRAGETWKETHTWRREHGLPATGGKRFGYTWTTRLDEFGKPRLDENGGILGESYDPDCESAPILKSLYEQYIGGKGMYVLASWLNDALYVPNTRGARWSRDGLKGTLDSGFGAGLLISHRPDARCGEPGTCQKYWSHFAYLPGAHPAIISDDMWEAYLERRRVARATPPRSINAGYCLSGLVRCGLCGGSATVHGGAKQSRGYAYRCAERANRVGTCSGIWMKRADVEAGVQAWIVRVRDELDALAMGNEVKPKAVPEHDNSQRTTALSALVAKLTAGLESAAEKYALGDIPREQYLKTRDKLQEKRQTAQADLKALEPEDAPRMAMSAFRDVIGSLDEEWDLMLVARKRNLLATMIRQVVLHPHAETPVVINPVWS